MRLDEFDVLSFDCYGTLIDWERGILGALTDFRAANHLDAGDDELLERFARIESDIQRGPYQRYRDVLRGVMAGLAAHYGVETFDADALVRSIPDWPPFPDTVPALQSLSRRYRLAIISNIDDDLFAHSARRLEVPFDWVITAQQAGAYKPSLRNFELAFQTIGVPPERILHVAQSKFHDHAPAAQLGLSSVWVNRRHGKTGGGATHPSDATPAMEVHSLAEFVARVEETA